MLATMVSRFNLHRAGQQQRVEGPIVRKRTGRMQMCVNCVGMSLLKTPVLGSLGDEANDEVRGWDFGVGHFVVSLAV
jgi:hypothetical protein